MEEREGGKSERTPSAQPFGVHNAPFAFKTVRGRYTLRQIERERENVNTVHLGSV